MGIPSVRALTPGDALFKQYVADSIKNEGDGKTYTFTISTGIVDRDKDTLAVDGWRVQNFLKAGGPVLWAHRSSELPIGKAPWVRAQGSALKARVEFAPEEVYPFAEQVRRLVDFGALKATSVGFLPDIDKAEWNEERGGIDFGGQELLEFSIVPVPANPDAIQDAKSAGLDVTPVKDWCIRFLDGVEPGQWTAKADIAQVLKSLSEPKVFIPAFDAAPILAEFQKRGRTLSAANEARIRTAADAASAVGLALDEVLAQVAEEPEDKAPVAPVLFVQPKPTFLLDPNDVKAAMVAAVSEAVTARVSRACGRLD